MGSCYIIVNTAIFNIKKKYKKLTSRSHKMTFEILIFRGASCGYIASKVMGNI
jgi:hypothetical protein